VASLFLPNFVPAKIVAGGENLSGNPGRRKTGRTPRNGQTGECFRRLSGKLGTFGHERGIENLYATLRKTVSNLRKNRDGKNKRAVLAPPGAKRPFRKRFARLFGDASSRPVGERPFVRPFRVCPLFPFPARRCCPPGNVAGLGVPFRGPGVLPLLLVFVAASLLAGCLAALFSGSSCWSCFALAVSLPRPCFCAFPSHPSAAVLPLLESLWLLPEACFPWSNLQGAACPAWSPLVQLCPALSLASIRDVFPA